MSGRPTPSDSPHSGVLVGALAAVLVLGAAGAAPAAWLDGLSLSLTPGGFEDTVRLPVPAAPDSLVARLLPYFTLGSHGVPVEPNREDSTGWARFQNLGDSGQPRFDVGAGVSLRVNDRLQLFGEYRFYQSRPSSGPVVDPLRRESDGPGLRGGISIPF